METVHTETGHESLPLPRIRIIPKSLSSPWGVDTSGRLEMDLGSSPAYGRTATGLRSLYSDRVHAGDG